MTVARREAANGSTVITIEGAFDNDAACRLQAIVREVAPDALLTLDFRDVRLFHDCAISALAAAISEHRKVRFVGLSEHHYRLLRYVSRASSPSHP